MSKFKIEERRLLIVLAFVQFTHVLDFVIMMPLGPQLMRHFSVSAGEFGFLVAAYGLSAGIAGFATSFFVDRFDRKTALLVFYSGFLIGTLFCAFSSSYGTLLMARCLAGGFGGVSGAALFSIIGDAIRVEKRGSATGIVVSSFSAASVIGVPIGLYFSQKFGWHMPFFGIVAVGLCNLLYAHRTLPSMTKHISREPFRFNFRVWCSIFGKSDYLIANVFIFVLMISNFIVIPFISPAIVVNAGIAESDLVYIYAFGGLFNFFSSQFVGRLVDNIGALRVYFGTAVLSVGPILAITHLEESSLLACMIMVAIFMVMASGRMVPAMTMINSVVRPVERGQFMSLNSSVQQMGLGLASLGASHIVEQNSSGQITGFDKIGYISVALVIVTMFLARVLMRLSDLHATDRPAAE